MRAVVKGGVQMRRRWTGWTAAIAMLISSYLPVQAGADTVGAESAVLTICYYAAGTENKMVAAPYKAEMNTGSRYRVRARRWNHLLWQIRDRQS